MTPDIKGLCERLEDGVHAVGIHDDNQTELFDIDGANETMHEAAAALTSLSAQLGEARELLARWQTWACGQQGLSPFQDVRDFLARQDQGK